ncbi:DUF2934 domain-containing protein [Methyloglobulus sp.]|uniref:DUF2934 domain-containing protein n=1 Tax=Methyloglobulus sp. TaxID=2518622 RepID=UPI0032B76FD8
MSKTAKNIKEDISTQVTNEIISLADLDNKVAEIAYHKAETRDFAPGHELDDWLEAEQELNLS